MVGEWYVCSGSSSGRRAAGRSATTDASLWGTRRALLKAIVSTPLRIRSPPRHALFVTLPFLFMLFLVAGFSLLCA